MFSIDYNEFEYTDYIYLNFTLQDFSNLLSDNGWLGLWLSPQDV